MWTWARSEKGANAIARQSASPILHTLFYAAPQYLAPATSTRLKGLFLAAFIPWPGAQETALEKYCQKNRAASFKAARQFLRPAPGA
jgi:hypothetical protein